MNNNYIVDFEDERPKHRSNEEKKEKSGIIIEDGANVGKIIYGDIEYFYDGQEPMRKKYSFKDIHDIIDKCVVPYMKNKRHLFALCKAFMHKGYVAPHDFNGALIFLERCYPDGLPYPFDMKDMSALDVQSMHKDIPNWDYSDSNAGQAFPTYLTVATQAVKSLPKWEYLSFDEE